MNFTSNGWTQFLPTAFLLNPYYFMHWCSLAQECLSHTPFTSPNLAQFLKTLANSIFSLRFPNPSCNWILGKVSLCHFVVHHLFYLVISLNSLFVPFLLSIAPSTLPCIQQVFCICWMNESIAHDLKKWTWTNQLCDIVYIIIIPLQEDMWKINLNLLFQYSIIQNCGNRK